METAGIPGPDTVVERLCGEFLISTDPGKLDLNVVHGYLTNCYWAKGISRALVARSMKNSLCFGVYDGAGEQVGFARVISDYATFAYVADVFIVESQRGRGLGRGLMESIVQHSALQGLRRWTLSTVDAHGLYARVGFRPLKWPERYMEILRPNLYERD